MNRSINFALGLMWAVTATVAYQRQAEAILVLAIFMSVIKVVKGFTE